MNGLRRCRMLMSMAPTIDDVEEDDDEDDDEIVIDVDVESIEDRNNNEDDDYVEDNESEGGQEPAVFVQREYEKTSTVSCGLRGLVQNKKLLPVLQEVVERINTILFHGSRLLNFYLIRQLSEGRDLVLLTTGLNGKLRHFFTALLTSRQINYDQDVLAAAAGYRAITDAHNIDFGSTAGITSLLNNAVANYEVTLMNSVTTTIHGRILRWLRHMLEVHCSVCFRNEKRGTAGAKYIISYLAWQANERADKPEFPLLLDKFLARNDHLRVVVLAALLTARVELYSISYALGYSLSKDYIKENWYKYFPLLFHILSYFNEHSIADAQDRFLERRRGKGLRTFTLAPVTKMRNGFILVDTTSLGEILAFAYARGRNRVPKSFPAKKGIIQRNQTMLRNPGKYWKDVLKIDKLSNSSKTFGFSIKTDGVSARVHFKKTCYTTDVGKDGFKTFGDKEYVQLNVENKRVVGLDPGRKDMFTTQDGSKKSYHCSGKEWRVISGAKSSKKQRDLWISKRDDIQTINSGMPSAKVCTVQKFSQYLGVVLENCSRLFHFYGSLKWRQLRRKTDIRRQKAYDVLCKRIAVEKLDSVVAYGSAKFSASSRGSPPIPTTHLYKKLLEKKVCVRLVWEHRTSVVCSVCHNDLPKGKKWRVKICPTCKIYWNRDVNAASNIRQIFLFMNGNNGQRPMQFKTFKERMLASSASNPAIPNDGQQAEDRGEENTFSDIPAQIPL